MTTQLTNLTTISGQPTSRQLPAVQNSNEISSHDKPDNVFRLTFNSRQDVANVDQSSNSNTNVEKQTEQSVSFIQEALQEINQSIQQVTRSLEFHIDEASGKTVVTVRDRETNEVIRQIPPDQYLVIAARLKNLQESFREDNSSTGILFNGQT